MSKSRGGDLANYLEKKAAFERQQNIIDSGNQRKHDAKIVDRNLVQRDENPCIECKKLSKRGTIFEETEKEFVARCGRTSGACKLNIRVPKKRTILLRERKAEVERDIEGIRQRLAQIHMDAIYKSQSQELYDEYRALKNTLNVVLRKESEALNAQYENVVYYKDRSEEILRLNEELTKIMNEIEELLKKPNKDSISEVVSLQMEAQKHNEALRDIYKPERMVTSKKDTKHNIISVVYDYDSYKAEDAYVKKI